VGWIFRLRHGIMLKLDDGEGGVVRCTICNCVRWVYVQVLCSSRSYRGGRAFGKTAEVVAPCYCYPMYLSDPRAESSGGD
jgi:hypothetical protein